MIHTEIMYEHIGHLLRAGNVTEAEFTFSKYVAIKPQQIYAKNNDVKTFRVQAPPRKYIKCSDVVFQLAADLVERFGRPKPGEEFAIMNLVRYTSQEFGTRYSKCAFYDMACLSTIAIRIAKSKNATVVISSENGAHVSSDSEIEEFQDSPYVDQRWLDCGKANAGFGFLRISSFSKPGLKLYHG